MNTIIIYATKHGATEKCSHKLEELIPGEITIANIKKDKNPPLEKYDTVIIGGSIHGGIIQKSITKFLEAKKDTLLKKKLGLFICFMDEEKKEQQYSDSFPVELRNHGEAKGLFGGEFNFDKMNFLQKAIVKKVSGIDHSISSINDDAIKTFAKKLK